VVQDALCHEDGEEVGWNLAGLVAKTKVRGQGYTVEMKIPLKAAGCPAAASGTRFSGNLCREKYSGSPDSRPSELQSWSPAPEGFGDRGSFGQILLTAGDAWHVFLPQEGAAVSATLHTIGKDRKWTLAPGGMKVAAEQDHVRFDMAVPSGTPETRRVTGTVFFGLGHPVDISKNPYVELRFRNGNPDVKLEFCYDYIDAAGKWNNNFFVFSSKDNAAPATRTFIWDLRKGNYIGRPEPKLLQRINVYAHVEPPLAAGTRGFSLSSIRLCRETMRGTAPELVPADSGLH